MTKQITRKDLFKPGIRVPVNTLQVLRRELTILLSSDQEEFSGKTKACVEWY